MNSKFDDDPETLRLLSIFLNSYITEDKLNQEICTIQELPLLRIILKIKLELITHQAHTLVHFPLNTLLDTFLRSDIDEFCFLISLALQIQSDSSQYSTLLTFIHSNLVKRESLSVLPYLKLLNVALLFCDKERKLFESFIDSHDFSIVIDSLLNSDNKTVTNYLIVNILPKFLDLNTVCTNKSIDLIWHHSLESQTLDIFCAIPLTVSYIDKDSFWYFLQDCLCSPNTTLQKQALFLLKQSICFVRNSKINSSVVSAKYENEWRNLFILYEIAREKQLHLIEPAYKLIPIIKVLHYSWLISIFKILLFHPHNTVCAYTIIDVLKSDWYNEIKVFKKVVEYLLIAINKIDFVFNQEIWQSLREFVKKLCDNKLQLLLKVSGKIIWIPSICYMFYYNILGNCASVCTSPKLTESIVCNIRKLPHKSIRSACLDLVIKFITLTCDKLSFNDFVFVNSLLYGNQIDLLKSSALPNYTMYIEDVLVSWQGNSNDVRFIPFILKIIKEIANSALTNSLLSLYQSRKLNVNVADRLCILYHGKQIETIDYINNRLVTINENDDTCLKEISSMLKIDEFEILIGICIDILLSDESNQLQTEIAFEIVNVWSSKGGYTDTVDRVLDKWTQIFLNGMHTNTSVCLNFIQLYARRQRCDLSDTVVLYEKILDTQDSDLAAEIFFQLQYLFNAIEPVEMLFSFLDTCIRKMLQLKGSEIFKICTRNLLNSVILNEKVVLMLEKCSDVLWSLFELTSSCEDLATSLSECIHTLSLVRPNVSAHFIPITVELLVFGNILQKHQRAEFIVCQLIYGDHENNPNRGRVAIRALAVKTIQNIVCQKDYGERADTIAAILLSKYAEYSNKRYFSDSQLHLNKLRILQGLLLIHDDVKKEKEALIDILLNSLCTENHQISLKFFIIWLLVRLLNPKKNCMEVITELIITTSKVHTSTIIAFIPILYHICLLRNDETGFLNTFETMLPWTMGAHFNLRLYAQEGIKRLYEVCNKRGYNNVCKKYKEIVDCISEVLNKTERKIDLIDEYIFEEFNPYKDFNLEMIYCIIPHITLITNDEYENIQRMLTSDPLFSMNDFNKWRSSRSQAIKHSEDVNTNIIQKKIIPRENSSRKTNELIVAASLVDKIPNLGGLSRTCEVFGVKQLLINSLAVLKNPEFKNLSVSSEHWVNITEVKIEQLQQFLLKMKETGYQIVGAEQTSDSIKLTNFTFPVKCVLVLGNEKEGISPNLLSLIDQCIEIPQFGVVRSLNVHVAAATFIWEYTKTHL